MSQNQTVNPSITALEEQIARLKGEAVKVQAEHTRPLLDHLLKTNKVEASNAKGSCWVGFKADTVEVTVDGTTYKVSVIVTDVAAVEAREAEKKAAAEADKVKEKLGPLLEEIARLQAQAEVVTA